MARSRYHELLVTLIRRLLKQNPSMSRDELDAAFRTARAASGGYARAERTQGPEGTAAIATALADDAAEDSYEELITEVQDALHTTFGGDAWSVATYPDSVVYYIGNPPDGCDDDDDDDATSMMPGMGMMPSDDDDDEPANEAIDDFDNAWEEAVEGEPDGDNDADDDVPFYRVQYQRAADDSITFGERQSVTKEITFEPVGGGDTAPDCYESEIDEMEEALGRLYGSRCHILATYPDRVVYCLTGADGTEQHWEQDYSEDEQTEVIQFGDKRAIEVSVNWEPVAAEDGVALAYTMKGASGSAAGGKRTLPANVQKAPANLQKQWTDVFNAAMKHCGNDSPKCEKIAFRMANGVLKKGNGVKAEAGNWGEQSGAVALAATTFSDKPWNGAASKYGSVEDYCRASLINLNTGSPDTWTADKCKLPYKEPGGAVNRAALRAVAATLGGARGGVKGVPPPALAKAKRDYAKLAKQAGVGAASGSVAAEASLALYDGERDDPLPARLRRTDWSQRSYVPVALRLDADPARLPVWQQLHKIGSWAIPHASGQRIQLTREMGNRIIENFRRGIVRRGVPLDERHFTDAGGHALGWLEDIRWGSERQGLPDGPDPDGRGPILYGRFRYNTLGQQKLLDEQYKGISPQYHLDYADAESGRRYGPTLLAVAATNNPYLRVRDLQGTDAPSPVAVLEDGLIRPQGAEAMDTVKLEALEARLEATERKLADERALRHQEQVTAYLHDAMRKGLPPALAKLAKPILLHSAPDAEPIVSLDEGSVEPTHNLHDLMKTFIAEIPRMPMRTLTREADERPFDPENQTAKLEDQFIVDYAKELRRKAGIEGPGAEGVLVSSAAADER